MRHFNAATKELYDDVKFRTSDILALLFYYARKSYKLPEEIPYSRIKDSLEYFNQKPEFAEITRLLIAEDDYSLDAALSPLELGKIIADTKGASSFSEGAYRITEHGVEYVENKLLGFVHDDYFPKLKAVAGRMCGD